MTNYDCYFGTQERAVDSLSLLLDYDPGTLRGEHRRPEVREFQKEIREVGTVKWLKSECTNQRWWFGMSFNKG